MPLLSYLELDHLDFTGSIAMAEAEAEAIGFKVSERVGGPESVSSLVSWALGGGTGSQIATPAVELRNCKTGGGGDEGDGEVISVFTCVGDVAQGEEVFRISSRVFLRAESEGKWRDHLRDLRSGSAKANDQYESLSERDKLSLRLLLESCDDGSHWRPYIDALPRDDPCLSSWDPESLEHLRDTPIWRSTKGFQSNLDILGEPGADLVEFALGAVRPTLPGDAVRLECTRERVRW